MPKKTTILAIDPGLRELGYAVVQGQGLLVSGVRALRLFPRDRRIREAKRLLRGWIGAYQPSVLVFEKTYPHPVPWLDEVHQLRLALGRLGRERGIGAVTYAPQTVRKLLLGNGRASKREMAEAITHRFPALRVYLTQDRRWKEHYWRNLFDAVALALHHEKTHL